MGCSFITLREPCNNQRSRIVKVGVKHQSIDQRPTLRYCIASCYKSFMSRFSELNDHASRSIVQAFNYENWHQYYIITY